VAQSIARAGVLALFLFPTVDKGDGALLIAIPPIAAYVLVRRYYR